MNDMKAGTSPIDRELVGEPVEAHGYVVTPVARVRARVGESDDEQGRGRYGFAAIRPVKVTVVDRSGNAQELKIVNAEQRAIAGMAAVGLAVAVVSVLIALLARTRRK